MNKNTSGALVVLIVALAGIYNDNMAAWLLAAIAAAMAGVATDLLNNGGHERAATYLGLACWLPLLAAVFSLAI